MSDRATYAYESDATDGLARTGLVTTPHGHFHTPAFMPVGTQATVKGLLPEQVEDTGAEILLGNTYHLHLRPGERLIADQGGLHEFMSWSRPILTDSGGFQVWSLSDRRKITDDGVEFKSHIDGSACFLGPKEATAIQVALGSDIIMSFDECIPYPADETYVRQSVDRTLRWEEETLNGHPRDGRAMFGIVQGGVLASERRRCAKALLAMPFDGFAIGGLFIGEERDASLEMAAATSDVIPASYARYVMGVGTPLEIVDCVMRGWDMFDCVAPTRNARHGTAMTFGGRLKLKNARFGTDSAPIEDGCPCLACRSFSRAYLRHLLMAGELLAATLMSHHNLTFMQRMMARIRSAIIDETLADFRAEIAEVWG